LQRDEKLKMKKDEKKRKGKFSFYLVKDPAACPGSIAPAAMLMREI